MPVIARDTIKDSILIGQSANDDSTLTRYLEKYVLERLITGKHEQSTKSAKVLEASGVESFSVDLQVDQSANIPTEVSCKVRVQFLNLVSQVEVLNVAFE